MTLVTLDRWIYGRWTMMTGPTTWSILSSCSLSMHSASVSFELLHGLLFCEILWRAQARRYSGRCPDLQSYLACGSEQPVDLRSLDDDDGSNNVVDPVKLLIIYALRLGIVRATSWATLLRDTLASPGKTIQWTMPRSPVLFGLRFRAAGIDMARAAPGIQQLRILRDAADLIGMVKSPVTHDLRRGAAKD
nr:hypothetical protein CFP56_34798 [Quercus suber]